MAEADAKLVNIHRSGEQFAAAILNLLKTSTEILAAKTYK